MRNATPNRVTVRMPESFRRAQRLAVTISLLAVLVAPSAGPAVAQTPSDGLPDVTLSMSVMYLTERDGSTDITVTAVLRKPVTENTTISLNLGGSPLLTPGVNEGAIPGTDYTTTFERGANTITIPSGSLTGATTFAIDPAYDTWIEGDEAIVLTGTIADGASVSPTDLIIEDGPYLSFPKSIYGNLSYPDQPISITVEEAINQAADDSTVTYALTAPEPNNNPLGLTFDPATRQLTGTPPAAADVPTGGLTTRYTITATDSTGHQATTLVSVAVINDVCSSTATTWFHATDEPPDELVQDCNVLLAGKDNLRGTGTLNWSTDTLITTPWNGISFHTDVKWIRKIELQLRNLNGVIPPVLGHLSSPASLDLVLGGDHRATDHALENKLTGPIPPELGLIPNMVVLGLSYNNLTGPIPRELANTGRLRFLYLADTDKPAPGAGGPAPPGVSGRLPAEFGDLPLRGLTITGNPGVTGHIPWRLGKNVSSGSHPGLQVLNLFDNNLEGNIPWQLGRFGKIQQMGLSGNRLTGAIPPELGNLGKEEAAVERRTVRLYLNRNQLTGSLPPELGGIANLDTLILSENRLTGAIPPELGALSKLQYLYLRDNRLTGAIPPELGALGALRHLILYNNQLRGPIPAELGRLSQLQTLSLSCNGLSGPVPASIGEITTLTELNLQGNPALLDSKRPDNLRRSGLTVKWTGQCEEAFTDVPPEASYEPAVSWMVQQGVTQGCSPTMFCPDSNLTRQQFVTFLWRAAGRPAPDYLGSAAFADVEEGVYSDRAIGWAVSRGVTLGCTSGSLGEEGWKFCPGQSVTRGQMAALLYRHAEAAHTGESSSYTDVAPDSFYADGIAWLTDSDVVPGCGPGLFCPDRDATRAEAAQFIHGVATRPGIWGPGAAFFVPPSP